MRSSEAGHSLIELMIATAIIGILMALYVNSQTRMDTDAALQAAKEEGHDQLILTLNLIRKNVKSKVPGTTVDVTGNSFHFSQRLVDGSVQEIKVSNRCRAVTGESFTVVARDASDSACLTRLDCQGMPYVEIELQSAAGANQIRRFPTDQVFDRNAKKKAAFAGLGLCVDKQMDSIKVRAIEVLFSRLTPGKSELHLSGMSYQMLEEARNAVELIR